VGSGLRWDSGFSKAGPKFLNPHAHGPLDPIVVSPDLIHEGAPSKEVKENGAVPCPGGIDGTRVNVGVRCLLVKDVGVDGIGMLGQELGRVDVRCKEVGFGKKLEAK